MSNGIITVYTLYVLSENGAVDSEVYFINANTTMFIISELDPYSLVLIQLSANTSVGEGPLSEVIEIRTAEASNHC